MMSLRREKGRRSPIVIGWAAAMISPTTCVWALWDAWLVGWLLAARSTAKTVARQSTTSRLGHSVPIWSGALLLFLPPRVLGILGRFRFSPAPPFAWAGVILVAVGLGFAGWARVCLGRFWSGAVTLKAEQTLVRTGPYAMTRHPIYSGLLLALTGTAATRATLGALVGLGLLLFGMMLKVKQEERLLLEYFGAAYRAYQEGVPAIVPRF